MSTYTTIPYQSAQPELVQLRRLFHQYPEPSGQEYRTSRMVFYYLADLGLTPERVTETGVVAMVWAPKGIRDSCETIAIRAELDAVCVEEKTGVSWQSKNPGVMHACGHDAIIACGLVLAKFLVQYQALLPVNVKLLFQPAEENGQGTRQFLSAGVMENPHVDRFVMIHFANDHTPGVEMHRGPSSAAIGSIQLTVHGKSAHLADASYGIDSIYAAAKIVEEIHHIQDTFQSDVPHIVGIGTIQGGTAKNVVARQTTLTGTIRSCSRSEYHRLRSICMDSIRRIEKETGTRIDIQIEDHPVPPIMNHPEMVDHGLRVGQMIWGEDARITSELYLSGDSAAYYFDHAKGIFMVFTAHMEDRENHPLHSAHFDLDEGVFWKTVATLHQFILEL